ncbi:MAG: TraB/GumN family protein [Eubacteriaceae bacterium]|nr:TraB/GumN family protein [Eubacteriaceae bacterium]
MDYNENVTLISLEGKQIYLLGTAHVSAESAIEAYELIKSVEPETVCIELDSERLYSLTHAEDWSKTNITDVIKQKRSAFMFISIILSSYQKRLAKQFGISAGQEMINSVKAAEEIGAEIVPIDRSIKTTFLRIWRFLSFAEKFKLLFSGIVGFLDDEEITEETLADLKTKDMLESALNELSVAFPSIKKYLVDERDLYLASGIAECEGEKVVAVVGAAHKAGILEHIEDKGIDRDKLNEAPESSKAGKALAWILPLAIVGIIAATLLKDPKAGFEQLKSWAISTSLLAGAGTLIGGGHILSILTAIVVAPFTSLNPLIAAGWFAGLVEAKLRNPTVGDFESLSDDLAKVSGLWKNRVTKILLVMVFANLGSSIGTIMGGIDIFKIFRGVLK